MKRFLANILAMSSVALLMLTSCKKNDTLVVTSGGKAGAFSASSTNIVLEKSMFADTSTVVTFNFTTPKYGYQAAVTNTMQFDSVGDNWKKPTSVALTVKSTSLSYNTADFNAMLLKMNFKAGVVSQVNVRVVSSISSSVTSTYSSVLTLNVTPFSLVSYIYVPGSYQSTITTSQWIPATADSLVSPTANGVYTGYVYFQSGSQFKITPQKNWNASYGDAGGGAISLTASGNLTAPAAGLYLLTVDLNQNKITYTTYNHTWSLIGDAAIDWNTDIAMPFVQNSNVYQVTTALKNSGGYKFRADDAWTISYGDVTPVTGQLTSNNGANLTPPAVAGTYTVSLSFGNPLLGPTYTVVKN
ncbi:SusE outer membrane protein [Mucilaginibacter mallensis]|uniref:SusE outer membrane protein n=1 Tax=Mucilaginibacter mallensis TaxID=652787 RepID=A0A1H2BZR3_MUCMA|nr:SusE domain-containing protein [Mucilaginibacter mallensis]SDT63775.1 SusE outer membrane protein [Mucilaginibacter mallensis]